MTALTAKAVLLTLQNAQQAPRIAMTTAQSTVKSTEAQSLLIARIITETSSLRQSAPQAPRTATITVLSTAQQTAIR